MKQDYFNTLTKEIIENNDKEKAIEIIANKLNEKQLSNEKEILTNIEKDNEIERLNNIIKEAREYIESYMPNYDFDKTNLIKLLEILDKENK